jgi:hypothetical protein
LLERLCLKRFRLSADAVASRERESQQARLAAQLAEAKLGALRMQQ